MGLWFSAWSQTPKKFLVRRGSGNAEIALKRGGIGLQGVACSIMHDRAPFQYHDAVGQPQNLLCILLDYDGADAARPGDGPERCEQFLDDDGRKPLGRLVQEQHFRVERERPADRQHLLLAAGKLVAEIVAAFFQPWK